MRNFVIGVILGFVLVGVGAYCYFQFGLAPVAVSAAPMPFETYFAHTALRVETAHAGDVKSPVEPSESNLLSGARTYRQNCAICHGLPGLDRTDLQKGMFPRPPSLLTGKGVTDDPVGRTHWVVQNGIRMTGMPTFQGTLTDQEIWQVSQLLAQAHNLPAPVQELLRQPDTVSVTAAAAAK